ncbi:MAG: C45 family autoproteolytic acyltransferase/hydrolase [Actinomycetota bacterium]
MRWPVVHATGGPRERGRAYGAAARERVHRSIELYEAIFRSYTGLPWAEVRGRTGPFAEPIDRYDAQLLPELEGIAEGAGVDAEDVLALNLRTEIMFGVDARTARRATRECTALCAAPSASVDGHLLHAQNWDWKPGARDTCVLLVVAPHDRPAFVTLVEAGLLAKCGMNEARIALTANALTSSRDRGEPGVPFHAILRAILTSATHGEATAAVSRAWRASSANYLISSGDGAAVNLEVGPGGPDTVFATTEPALVHANHFLWPDRPFKDLGRIDGEDSLRRQSIAEAALRERADVETFAGVLRDHEGRPSSVCAHEEDGVAPEDDYVTVASLIMRPDDGELLLTHGNPCGTDYERLRVDELVAQARAGSSRAGGLPRLGER